MEESGMRYDTTRYIIPRSPSDGPCPTARGRFVAFRMV